MITVVAPEAANRLTGGHLVNDRLAAQPGFQLMSCSSLQHCADLLKQNAADLRAVLMDSLFLTDPHGVDHLRQTLSAGPRPGPLLVLIAHSLPSMIPGPTVSQRSAWAAAERRTLAMLDLAIAPSRFIAQAVARRGMPAGRVRHVPLAPVVDGRGFRVRPASAGATPASASGPVRVLTIANWGPAKGIDRVLTALRSARDFPWQWTIVGEWRNDYGRRLHRTMQPERANGRVSVIDSMQPDELASLYASANLFVLPSVMESYGLVFAEAMTFGVPSLALKAAAVPETVGDAGILTGAGDRESFTRELWSLLGDRSRLRELSARATVRAQLLPDWAETADRVRAACSTGRVS